MIKKILDLHIHSKYSRACSGELELPKIAEACRRKGIDIVATGDYTHPGWLEHIKGNLEEIGKTGLYQLSSRASSERSPLQLPDGDSSGESLGMTGGEIKFILSTEISCIYKHKDKTRRLHLVILAPNIEAVEKFNAELEKRGVNLKSDGRPIMGLSGKEVLKILLGIDKRFLLIPAHAWTPWFSVFGSKSGYDTLEECFEELTPHIRAIETGLSSDPVMNHRLSALDNITLVSNSDAHSPENLGREANVFGFTDEADINYDEITRIIKEGDRKKFLYTIEFFPEEGKYHFDGHLDCGVCLSPAETKKNKNICPKCKKELTIGVLYRVDDLADRSEEEVEKMYNAPKSRPATPPSFPLVRGTGTMEGKFIPHRYVVPLREVLGKVFGVGPKSKKVDKEYVNLIKNLGSEFEILLDVPLEKIKAAAGDDNIAVAIDNMRAGNVKVHPGFDGQYGVVEVLAEKSNKKDLQKRLF